LGISRAHEAEAGLLTDVWLCASREMNVEAQWRLEGSIVLIVQQARWVDVFDE
jgi:hypothetical protein